MTAPADRRNALEILDAAVADGARAREVAALLGVGLTTLQRWRRQFSGDGDGLDRRKGSHRLVSHRLSDEERQRILLTCNEPEFAALPPGQIVPGLADRGVYIGSERSFYRVLHAHGQAHRRGRARPPQAPRPVPRLEARGPNQVWSWDITYLPTSVRGAWLYLYLVIDVWSRKVVAWDVADREVAQIAADLVGRACLRERISKGRRQPLILHADNGNAMRAATLESRLEELYSIRCCSANSLASANDANSSMFRNSSRSLPLNDSTNGFSQGEPGGMYSVPDPLPVHHSCSAWAMNSGPLSIRRWVGAGYCPRSSSMAAITSTTLHLLSTRIARQTRLYSSRMFRNFSLRPSIV